MDDTWLILIGCLDFYHFNNFNSYISLEINFFLKKITKIHDFFSSINRDLVHLIWTQKKKPTFSLSLSFDLDTQNYFNYSFNYENPKNYQNPNQFFIPQNVLNKLLLCCIFSLLSCILSYLCVACLVCCIAF